LFPYVQRVHYLKSPLFWGVAKLTCQSVTSHQGEKVITFSVLSANQLGYSGPVFGIKVNCNDDQKTVYTYTPPATESITMYDLLSFEDEEQTPPTVWTKLEGDLETIMNKLIAYIKSSGVFTSHGSYIIENDFDKKLIKCLYILHFYDPENLAIQGAGSMKKEQIVFSSKQYVVKKDKEGNRYITVSKKKMYLKDIKGRYRVLK
jgi:hypothetical protein